VEIWAGYSQELSARFCARAGADWYTIVSQVLPNRELSGISLQLCPSVREELSKVLKELSDESLSSAASPERRCQHNRCNLPLNKGELRFSGMIHPYAA
jgi:hypothetical protein